jgi:hypothetical protein
MGNAAAGWRSLTKALSLAIALALVGPACDSGPEAGEVDLATTEAGMLRELETGGFGVVSSVNRRTRPSFESLVRCALPRGAAIQKTLDGVGLVTFEGELGLAPRAERGPCDKDCQEVLSACVRAP